MAARKSKKPERASENWPIDITDPELFGNEAGEDEDPQVLRSYFVDKPEFAPFSRFSTPLAIVRARKGMGKSALLSKIATDKQTDDDGSVVVFIRGSDLAAFGDMVNLEPNQLINEWQQRLCAMINYEIGSRIKFASSDTTITMVESSELAGFKGRNLLGCLLERFGGILKSANPKKASAKNSFSLLRNFKSQSDLRAWVIIDDIDATFINTPSSCLQISTFFSACRRITRDVKGLAIRASVRSDVWSVVKRTDEALDKCEQYITDIQWSTEEAKRVLENKIYAYIQRTETVSRNLKRQPRHAAISTVFVETVPWGGNERVPMHKPIHILSAGRPRWAAQLCKMAATQARKSHRGKIGIGDIASILKNFGKYRLDDLYREHSHQYPGLQKLIESFANGPKRYTTEVLLSHIAGRVIRVFGLPEIDGEPCKNGALDPARFLFKIGFIQARQEKGGGLSFVRFEDRTDLLSDTVNPDDGLVWEIHPSYRNILRISRDD